MQWTQCQVKSFPFFANANCYASYIWIQKCPLGEQPLPKPPEELLTSPRIQGSLPLVPPGSSLQGAAASHLATGARLFTACLPHPRRSNLFLAGSYGGPLPRWVKKVPRIRGEVLHIVNILDETREMSHLITVAEECLATSKGLRSTCG